MKCFFIETKKEDWLLSFYSKYLEKIKREIKFDILYIKPVSAPRAKLDFKLEKESDKMLAKIEPKDFVILLDEKGKDLSTLSLSKKLRELLDRGNNLVFIVGGAFGVSQKLKNRANLKISLSALTLNHHVAQTVLLEQIYRCTTIWSGKPYHNE